MTNLNVAFCGLSKNCINTIDENIKHIVSMRNNYREININLFIVDSDSSDGTKEIISKYEKDNEFIVYRDLDDLENPIKWDALTIKEVNGTVIVLAQELIGKKIIQ